MRRALIAIGLALAVVLAGCSGGLGPGSGTAAPGADDETADSSGDATVNFYVSDERNAIGDFEHLNVTITEVGFKRAEVGDDDEADDAEATTDANETTANATTTNETVTTVSTAETTTPAETSEEDDETGDSWIVRDVNDTTVDLTELQGANATLVDAVQVPAGNYTTVFAHVSDVNGTLATGEQVNVKLPSQKLQVHTPFTVGPNESADFVFDITVFKAGNSGKYILKPVVGESGTDVEMETEGSEDDGDDSDETRTELQATIQGPVTAGENVTLSVTDGEGAVANATVVVNDEAVGQTDADGQLTITVPDAEELEVEVTKGDAEGELEREIRSTTATNTAGATTAQG